MKTTYWDVVNWKCDCGRLLEPSAEDEHTDERGFVVEPIVVCPKCGTIYDVEFEPRT